MLTLKLSETHKQLWNVISPLVFLSPLMDQVFAPEWFCSAPITTGFASTSDDRDNHRVAHGTSAPTFFPGVRGATGTMAKTAFAV